MADNNQNLNKNEKDVNAIINSFVKFIDNASNTKDNK